MDNPENLATGYTRRRKIK